MMEFRKSDATNQRRFPGSISHLGRPEVNRGPELELMLPGINEWENFPVT